MENKNTHRDIWIVALAIISFALWKLSSLQFRFGDENVYFYMSDAILRGFIPYKDFFFADPPFFIYMMAIFKAIFGSHIILFKTLPILFDSLSAILIYLLLRKNNIFAALGPIFYLFSFTILSTSDYVTGAEVMMFFILLALYSDQNKKHFWSGAFWALACLSKLYAGPALLGFLFYKLISKEFLPARNIILGGLAATIVILLPFFILAPHQVFYDLIIHQFNRPTGINKWNILSVFARFEWLLIISSLLGMFIAKNKSWIYPLIFSAVFFLLYKDLYYLYLHLLLPFIIFLAVEFAAFLNKKREEIAWAFIVFYIFVSFYSISGYVNTYGPQGIFNQPEEIAEALKTAPEDFPAYGAQEIAPLVALMSGRKIFGNVIDTNTQNFAAETQNLDLISEKATKNGIYLVARVANYPEQNMQDTGFEGYFNKKIFDSSCKFYKSFDRNSPGDPLNQVTIYKCHKTAD
ncbi:hypothetical protein A3F97_02135 [Candidatus Nomurabacteria bacterium RIFCSPLOWO2_12_FULL_41_10]|uniref:Glycosyltransferase RgtA/B/C/D-like domain-containing protein n=1 Tax=Candidatus Nomurabacteria bacterium RIFCSPLOWO2_12_FULL_41_10 TaxID=1801795 RepID=A0A1F6YD27_9BACT|nr:MAG: hypothetical protein A3F97_02135 [Candidatus Nomurabacteria bacterium RIFCSPLOWO2_12_FULL_41_10]